MIDLMSTATLARIVVVAMFVLGFIFSRLYQRSSKERAFVRTGLGGQKVIMDGGALKLLNMTKRLSDLLVLTKLATIFDSHDSEDAAVKSFS